MKICAPLHGSLVGALFFSGAEPVYDRREDTAKCEKMLKPVEQSVLCRLGKPEYKAISE